MPDHRLKTSFRGRALWHAGWAAGLILALGGCGYKGPLYMPPPPPAPDAALTTPPTTSAQGDPDATSPSAMPAATQ